MSKNAPLSPLSEIKFNFKTTTSFPVGCPTLNLITAWDGDSRNVYIYRPDGQIVSRIHRVGSTGTKPPEALAMTWKPDGQFLAVGWSDGCVRLMGLENNKTAHHLNICDHAEARITYIGWATNATAPLQVKLSLRKPRTASKEFNDDVPSATALGLPDELTFLEVDTALPNISPLPSSSAESGDDATVFTLRSGIEFLFQPPKRADYDGVNVMVVGTSDGRIHLSIYDSFIIGIFDSPIPELEAAQLISHASHSQISTHSLLLANASAQPSDIYLVSMDLPLISSSPINLALLASKLTMLQTLLRYVKQTQLHLEVEWRNIRQLPGRFLQSIQEDLRDMESGPRDIVSALYHTVVTGHAHGPVREWLMDSLAERGHKRWDKAVVSGLENLRILIHENFLPSLDRCVIILSRLRGFAQFYDTRDDLGFTVSQISRVIDIFFCLSLVGHKMLAHVMDELEHFVAFSSWLRFQIDEFALSSRETEEITEKEATMDTPKVLGYIERYLTNSPLDIFLDEVTKEDYTSDWQHIEDGPSLLHVLDRQLQKQESGESSMKALPHVDFLVNYARTWCEKIFRNIADAKKRSVRFSKPTKLSIGSPITNMDMKMCKLGPKERGVVYVALASETFSNKVFLFHEFLTVANGISTNEPTMSCCLDFGNQVVTDFKFLNAKTLFILCSAKENALYTIISVSVQSDTVLYTKYRPGDSIGDIPVTSTSSLDPIVYDFPSLGSMRPIQMEVLERQDVNGEISDRISLLDVNRSVWRTFTVPELNLS